MQDYITSQIEITNKILCEMIGDKNLLSNIESIAKVCCSGLKSGHRIFLAGNGGSAADAQHIAGEFVSRFAFDRPGLSAIALTTDTSILTAIGNDYGFDMIFARQIQALCHSGDIFFAYSTSGKSPNILAALREAKKHGVITIGMTGKLRGPMNSLSDYCIQIPSIETPKIQEGHAVVGHIICGLVEQSLFKTTN